MTATIFDVAGHRLDLSGGSHLSEEHPRLRERPALTLLLAAGTLCNDAWLQDTPEAAAHALGDPTETSIVVAAARLGLRKPDLDAGFPRLAEVPFDSHRKRMSTIHRVPLATAAAGPLAPFVANISGDCILFSKGAVEHLLAVSNRVWLADQAAPLDAAWRQRILSANDELAQKGMRVLAVAFRPLTHAALQRPPTAHECDLVFVGMIGIIDPPRPEAKEAVLRCRQAGIRTVMITGDQATTARQIAHTLGITSDDRVVEGQELDHTVGAELQQLVDTAAVYARVSPEHKLRIIEALQQRGHVVAMTGDGINDAPALRKADIGVAMGQIGTDVAKEAADMVLLDDNFATIVAAVEEGRVIYDNIRKFLKYLMTTNSAELGVMLLGPVTGMPLPLLPLQILWMNLVTDGAPALALGVEPPEHDVMRRPPRPPNENIFAGGITRHILWVGALMIGLSLGVSYWYWRTGQAQWQTMLFTTLSLSQMGHVLAIRSGRASLFQVGLLSNLPLFGAAAATVLAQLLIVYLPAAQRLFQTLPLSAADLVLAIAASTVVFWAVEVEKWAARRGGHQTP